MGRQQKEEEMWKPQDLLSLEGAKYLEYQPGNGTRYDMYFIPNVRPGIWVVAVPNFNVSMEISDYCMVDWGYVHEKFSRGGKSFNECDASAMADVIGQILGCPRNIHTDSNGRWTDTSSLIRSDIAGMQP